MSLNIKQQINNAHTVHSYYESNVASYSMNNLKYSGNICSKA